jgi:hypothetical protein
MQLEEQEELVVRQEQITEVMVVMVEEIIIQQVMVGQEWLLLEGQVI